MRLLIVLAILILSCDSSSPGFYMIYSVYKLNKQYTALSYSFAKFEPVSCSMSRSNCCFLTCMQVIRKQVNWSGTPISLRITDTLISNTTKEMLKILQARLQQYVNWELPDVQTGFRKGRGTKDQIGNICWIKENSRKGNFCKEIPEKYLLLLQWLC